jgi:hypothetical protein
MCEDILYEVCNHVWMKPCRQNCGRVDKTHEITKKWGWCPRKECQDQRHADAMAYRDTQIKLKEARKQGALHAQVSGAQKAVEQGATTHTKSESTPRLATANPRQGAARAVSATRRARKVEHRRLMPQTDQSPHATRAETAEDATQNHDQAKPEAQKRTSLFHKGKGKQK